MNSTLETPIGNSKNPQFSLRGISLRLVQVLLIEFGVCLVLWFIRRFIQGPFYRKTNRIDGKVVIVTGWNTGISKETVLELARRGAKIYMACRNPVLCEEARIEIMARTQNKQLINCVLDLASLESIRQFVARFKDEETQLDLLINNAGVMACPRSLTTDGFEMQLGMNHLGRFLLTSSLALLFGRINRKDLMSERKYSKLLGAYTQSKLANVLFTRKLAMLLTGAGFTVICCHLGLVRSNLNRHFVAPSWFLATVSLFSRYFFKSTQAGAQTQIYLALDPTLAESTGGLYADSFQCPLLPWARDVETTDWLWQESERLVDISRSAHSVKTVSMGLVE